MSQPCAQEGELRAITAMLKAEKEARTAKDAELARALERLGDSLAQRLEKLMNNGGRQRLDAVVTDLALIRGEIRAQHAETKAVLLSAVTEAVGGERLEREAADGKLWGRIWAIVLPAAMAVAAAAAVVARLIGG